MKYLLGSVLVSLIATLALSRISSLRNLPSSSFYSVEIKLGEQKGYLYAGNSLILEFPVTTGKPGYETPTGDFQIRLKARSHRSSIYGRIIDPETNVVIYPNVDARRYRGTSRGIFEGIAA